MIVAAVFGKADLSLAAGSHVLMGGAPASPLSQPKKATQASQLRRVGDDRRAETTGGKEAVPLAKTRLSLILCIIVMSLLAARTWLQAQTWKDSTASLSSRAGSESE